MRGVAFGLIFCFLLIFLVFPVSALEGFAYYRNVTITNNVDQNLTDYQIKIVLDTASLISQGKMRSDCGDIRFTDLSNNLLPYWLREGTCNNASTEIWVRVPSIPANSSTTIRLWYRNPIAQSMSNGELVYEFFDNFTTLNTTKWSTFNSPTISISDGIIQISSTGANCVGIRTTLFPVLTNMRLEAKLNSTQVNYWSEFCGAKSEGGSLCPAQRVYGADITIYHARETTSTGSEIWKAPLGSLSTFPKITWTKLGTNHSFYYNDVLKHTRTITSTLTNTFVIAECGGTSWVDYIIVTKHVSPEPSISIGLEEQTSININDALRVKVQYLDTGSTTYNSYPLTLLLSSLPDYSVSKSIPISNINPDYGANVTVELLNKFTLINMSYNGNLVNYNYLGQNTSNGRVYNVYNFTVTANATLTINATYANRAYNSTLKLDREQKPIGEFTVVIGEVIELTLPVRGNVMFAGMIFVNVTQLTLSTRNIAPSQRMLSIAISSPETDDYGSVDIPINLIYANRTVTVFGKGGVGINNVSIFVYNIDTNKVSTTTAIEAGNNTIEIYFRDMKLQSSQPFYVNHTNITDTLTFTVNATRLPVDYKNARKTIYAQKDFDATALDSRVSRFALNLTEPSYVYVDLGRNHSKPSFILENCSLISYAFSYAKFYCIGNATIAEGYRISVITKDALNRAINVAFMFGSETFATSNGRAEIVKPVDSYTISFPREVLGFKLKTNQSYEIILEDDATISATYKVPAKITTREVRVEKRLPFPFPFLPFETKEAKNIARVKLEGSIEDYFGAPVQNRNVVIEIVSSSGIKRYANTTTDASGNFRTETDFITNTSYLITYILPEDDIYAGATSIKSLTYEAISPPPPPGFQPPEISSTVIVAIVAVVAISAIAIMAKTLRKKATQRIIDSGDFRFFRRLK